MKHLVVFLTAIFVLVFFYFTKQREQGGVSGPQKSLKVYSYSSFISSWGPGPILKEQFEKSCACRVDFYDGADSGILLKRLQEEGIKSGIDVVIGLDQFDIAQAEVSTTWRNISVGDIHFIPEIQTTLNQSKLYPFDWGLVAFVGRKSDTRLTISSFESLLNQELKNQIAMEDPRTSSPGLLFLFWLIQSKGEEGAFDYLKKFVNQAHSFSSSWSQAYGLFQNKTTRTALSYLTSPLYHELVEKNLDYNTFVFSEGHPVSMEYLGIPDTCTECELAEKFVKFIYSKEAQKVIMEKNYMFPVVDGVIQGTPFEKVPFAKSIFIAPPSPVEKQRILSRWDKVRKGESE